MAKFIILFFVITGTTVGYFTYTGIGQENIETLKKQNIRSNSSHNSSSGGSWGSSSSYNSSGYSYGK